MNKKIKKSRTNKNLNRKKSKTYMKKNWHQRCASKCLHNHKSKRKNLLEKVHFWNLNLDSGLILQCEHF